MLILARGFIGQKIALTVSDKTAEPMRIVLELGATDRDCVPEAVLDYTPTSGNDPRVTGTITDFFDGKPIAGVSVIIQMPDRKEQLQKTTTNKEGRFELEGIAPGYYDIVLTRSAYFQETIKQVLVPREDLVVVNSAMLNAPVICQ